MVSEFLNFYGRFFARRYLISFHKTLYRLALRGLGFLNHQDPIVSGEKGFLEEYLRNIPMA